MGIGSSIELKYYVGRHETGSRSRLSLNSRIVRRL